jgi:hypothetical protein
LPDDLSAAFAECPAIELEDAIEQLHALNAGVHRTLLQAIQAYIECDDWQLDGANSFEGWLSARLSISPRTAGEWVRAAESLSKLPEISHCYFEGTLSWDQVRQLVKFATPETDAELAERAKGLTANQLQRVARSERTISAAEDHNAFAHRTCYWRWDRERNWLELQAILPAADGAIVVKALERISSQALNESGDEVFISSTHRQADALVQLASQRLDADFDADRATVVVHVDGRRLADGSGVAELEGGAMVSIETALRLGCDGNKEIVVEDAEGRPIGIGRRSRQVPGWLIRQLRHRDDGCRFPGCNRKRWLHAHHLVHWAHGGSTDSENLILLCGFHHRFLHQQKWRVEGDPNGELIFVRPEGTRLKTRPQPLLPEIRRRLLPVPT